MSAKNAGENKMSLFASKYVKDTETNELSIAVTVTNFSTLHSIQNESHKFFVELKKIVRGLEVIIYEIRISVEE